MSELKIPNENVLQAMMFIMTEIYAQNTAILRLLAQEVSDRSGEPMNQIRKNFSEDLENQRRHIQELLYANFGPDIQKNVSGGKDRGEG